MYKHEHNEESGLVVCGVCMAADRRQGCLPRRARRQGGVAAVARTGSGSKQSGCPDQPSQGLAALGKPCQSSFCPPAANLGSKCTFHDSCTVSVCEEKCVCVVRVEHHLWVCRNWYSHPDRLSIPACFCQSLRAHAQVHLEHNLTD